MIISDFKRIMRRLRAWFFSLFRTKEKDDQSLVLVEILDGEDNQIEWHVYNTGKPQWLKIGPFVIRAQIMK